MLIYQPELWGDRERLVYKPKALLFSAQLNIEFEKHDEHTAQLRTTGIFKAPFAGEKQKSYITEVLAGSPVDHPDVLFLPILLRSNLREHKDYSFELRAAGKPVVISFLPQKTRGDFEVQLRGSAGTQSGKAVWDFDAGVLKEITAPLPVVGGVTLLLSEHLRS